MKTQKENQKVNDLKQKKTQEKHKEIETILNDLSDENKRLEEENKVFKKLYEEEVNAKNTEKSKKNVQFAESGKENESSKPKDYNLSEKSQD